MRDEFYRMINPVISLLFFPFLFVGYTLEETDSHPAPTAASHDADSQANEKENTNIHTSTIELNFRQSSYVTIKGEYMWTVSSSGRMEPADRTTLQMAVSY